jgi:hypothetical protein
MGYFTEMIIPGSREESSPLQCLNYNKIVPDIRSSIMVPKEISLTSQKSSSYVGQFSAMTTNRECINAFRVSKWSQLQFHCPE